MIKIWGIPMTRRTAEVTLLLTVDAVHYLDYIGKISTITDKQLETLLTQYGGTK